MARSPVSVVVAEGRVSGAPQVILKAPAEVRIRRGDHLELKFTYDLEETSVDKETYGFVLRSKVGPQEKPPAEARMKDRMGTPQSQFGYVVQRYEMDAAGTFEASFEALAEYRRQRWFRKSTPKVATKAAKGTLRVIVE